MTMLRALSVVVLAAGAVSMGCADGAGDLDTLALDAPARAPLGGPAGSTGTNNLPPPDVHENRATLYQSAQAALSVYDVDDELWWLATSTANDALAASEGGRTLLKYAVRCSFPSTSTLNVRVGTVEYAYPGQGLLATAPGWQTGSLSLAATQDLFTCLLAHMNAHGVEVPINLSGPSVTNKSGDDANFTWEEALWAVKITPGGASKLSFSFHVWPLDDLTECAEYVGQLQDRVCGTYSGTCGLTVRTDRATACAETATGWYCDDPTGSPLPAIKTRLKVTGVELLYDSCP